MTGTGDARLINLHLGKQYTYDLQVFMPKGHQALSLVANLLNLGNLPCAIEFSVKNQAVIPKHRQKIVVFLAADEDPTMQAEALTTYGVSLLKCPDGVPFSVPGKDQVFLCFNSIPTKPQQVPEWMRNTMRTIGDLWAHHAGTPTGIGYRFAKPKDESVTLWEGDPVELKAELLEILATACSCQEVMQVPGYPFDQLRSIGVKMEKPVLAYDIEICLDFSGKDKHRLSIWHEDADLLCISISWFEKGEEFFEPKSLVIPGALFTDEILRILLENSGIMLGHNEKFDRNGTWKDHREVHMEEYTTFLCSLGLEYVLNQNPKPKSKGGTGLGLKPLCQKHLGAPVWDEKLEIAEEGIKQEITAHNRRFKRGEEAYPRRPFTYGDFIYEDLALYCGLDTGWTLLYWVYAWGKLIRAMQVDEKDDPEAPNVAHYYFFLYTNMVNEMALIERAGIYVNEEAFKDTRKWYQTKIDEMMSIVSVQPVVQTVAEKLDSKFNVKSVPFMSALIEEMEYTELSELTDAGSWSCNKHVLARLRGGDDKTHKTRTYDQKLWNYIFYIRRYRDIISKNIKSTLPYVVDGMVRPQIRTAVYQGKGTKTSRVTTTNPSTNTWLKDERFLMCMTAPEDHICVKWDWKSIEPMVHALLAGEESWLDIFWNYRKDPEDPRADVYRMIFGPVIGVEPEDVTKSQRDQAKIFLLAMLYDRHPRTVAEALRISEEEARKLCDDFWAIYPSLARRANTIKLEFLRGNYIHNPFGQRAYYPNRAGASGYKDSVLKIIEKNIHLPMYDWSTIPEVRQHIHHDDIADCRKVGNWEIQSSGWAITASMITPLRKLITGHAVNSAINETIHDAYRSYLPLDRARTILDASFPMLEDLSNGALNRYPQHRLRHTLKVKNLKHIPVCVEAEIGPNFGQLKKYLPGMPIKGEPQKTY